MQGYQKGRQFQIYRCKNCNTSFSNPHEADEKIYDYIYTQAAITPGYNRYAVYASEIKCQSDPLHYLSLKEGAYYAIKTILEEQNDKSLSILEVGSGLGYLTFAIHQKGFNITGLDISTDAVANSIERFGDFYVAKDVYQYASGNRNRYDMVILTEVIEHVHNPGDFCDHLISLLNKDGKLIITTPNKSAFPATDIWETELPPVHLSWFSEKSFKVLAKEMNLTVKFFDFTLFNERKIDVTKFNFYERFYKVKTKQPVLDEDGKIINPVTLKIDKGLKGKIKKVLKRLVTYLIVNFFSDKSNMARNQVLCVILEKGQYSQK